MCIMELSETKNLIRDLDLTLQPRIPPRYKVWLPLATQQLRLRNLVRIIGHNLKCDGKCDTCWFYYTIHRTSMSSPLYTSEAIDNSSPRWASLEVPTLYATGHSTASEIVLRLWRRIKMEDTTSDVNLFTWGISFTGLVYIGPKLVPNLENIFHDNTLVFQFHGGYFTPSYSFHSVPELKRFLCISIGTSEVKDSYTVNKLSSLRSKMQALKQQSESVQQLRERIASGSNIQVSKYPQTMLNRLLQPKRISKEKKAEILKIKKELEVAKFRTKLLEQERVRKMGEVRLLNQRHSDIVEENQDHGLDLMDRYRELKREIERLNEWRQSHMEKKEMHIQLTGHLFRRQRQLISELSLIYPITQESDTKLRINDVYLPDSESLETANDTHVAVALGFVAHTTLKIASFLNVPLLYNIIHYGSRSKIVDNIKENIPDNDRQFPLYVKGKDKLQFHYAVYLLNKNIAQLRWYCGLPTADLRQTLSNLATLIAVKPNQQLDSSKRTFSGTSLDNDMNSSKHSASVTPPIQKVLFEKCHRTSQSMSQLKNAKILFGSSLDQGLDKPLQPPNLSSRLKRICKSEESAIDNSTLTLPRELYSSTETVYKDVMKSDGIVTALESNIEIMMPTSISKSAASSSTPEESTDYNRQRSSNSISSCEMALSASQLDGEDNLNENFLGKHQEVLEPKRVCENRTCEDGVGTSNRNLSKEQVFNENKDFEKTSNDDRVTQNVFSALSNDSSVSLTDVMETIQRGSKGNCMASSICSEPEDQLGSSDFVRIRRRCESESRQEEKEFDAFCKNWKRSKINRMKGKCVASISTEYDQNALETTLAHFSSDEEGIKTSDLQASTEYLDSIRRSSENVFARTEALASKKTSFKVMRPRM